MGTNALAVTNQAKAVLSMVISFYAQRMRMTDPYLDIARQVLGRVCAIDGRFKVVPGQADSWAAVFRQAGNVWKDEALQAVSEYYATARFPIMPVDVIEYCKKQPAHSSYEHALSVVDDGIKNPASRKVETLSGIEYPEKNEENWREYPDIVRNFLQENRERLAKAIVQEGGNA
ncbi:hypothetical protein HOT81_gp100 [Gordonia phage Fryberger]|uniref:Uncharacterized protein n=1 Tax=Gordonia phage Fryberger TaxID=2250392 RepID=A0A346FCQ2_9CAUD|nr:hypothetical protein HOT81_gp100 [Gordonia phage Fryberger]AXN53516.1 hypothetical protein SEA_FRYBERGER_100 [Gordonia phage Fryberger]